MPSMTDEQLELYRSMTYAAERHDPIAYQRLKDLARAETERRYEACRVQGRR